MRKKFWIIFSLFILNSLANAQIGINLGTEYGLGAIVQAGTEEIKLEAGGGLNPLVVVWSITRSGYRISSSSETIVKLYFPGIIGIKLNLKLSGEKNKNRLGLKFGISYNTILKTGFGGGLAYDIKGMKNTITITGGMMIFSKADDELLVRLNKEEGTFYTNNEVSAVLLTIQPYIGFSVFW